MTLIKICGIKEIKMAFFAADIGADFIGIVFDPLSMRYVSLEKAKEIALSAERGGAKTIGVFTKHNQKEMEYISQKVGLKGVQLHGDKARQSHFDLPLDLIKIYVLSIDEKGNVTSSLNLEGLDPKRDYLLYDGMQGGSGKSFDWNSFSPHPSFPFFLAGGLHLGNVLEAIEKTDPVGVDVSSGVEDPKTKEKTSLLIQEFIEKVKKR